MLDFLTKLAPQGETFLVVRQKPQLKDGQYQFHADGAIKATWPAMLPDTKIKPDWAAGLPLAAEGVTTKRYS